MSGLNEQAKIQIIEVDAETANRLKDIDYILIGGRQFISRERATQIVDKLANEDEQHTKQASHIADVNGMCSFCITKFKLKYK